MGYYTGEGVVVSGGDSRRLFGTLCNNGAHHVFQRTISTVTKKCGVALATAQSEQSTMNLTSYTFNWANLYPWFGAQGTQKSVSYNQINGSNLYELIIRNDTLSVSDG